MSEVPERYEVVLDEFRRTAHIKSAQEYDELYRRSVTSPEEFWAELADEHLSWEKKWDSVLTCDFDEARIEWFGGGTLNAAHNCVDRHLDRRADVPALRWEANDQSRSDTITYKELHERTIACAAMLQAHGIGRGDRVVTVLPTIPELPIIMLACARIGAVHCTVHPGFSPSSIAHRITTCEARIVITCDTGLVDGAMLDVKAGVDEALKECPSVETVVVVQRADGSQSLSGPKEKAWTEALSDPGLPTEVPPEPMGSEDPLFVLFISGATGKPKAIVHTHAGYLLYASLTTRLVLDAKNHDILWHFDDINRITGHSYAVYGPLLNGLTSMIFEGLNKEEGLSRVIDTATRHGVTKLMVQPSTVRVLSAGADKALSVDESPELQLIALTEELLDEDTWTLCYESLGRRRCPVLNAYGQTETGGLIIAPVPAVSDVQPGSSGKPFFGIEPVILDPDTGEEVTHPHQEGVLCARRPWPGIARTVWDDHERFLESYFLRVPGFFFTGDGAKRDEDGNYLITGRIDDVLNVAGRRLGIPEVETALVTTDIVGEAAVVGFPHPVKGTGIYAFVMPADGSDRSERVKQELIEHVQKQIGDFAEIDVIQWTDTLPRTPSGKLLRVLLQRIAAGRLEDLGDAAAMADPDVVEHLVQGRMELPAP